MVAVVSVLSSLGFLSSYVVRLLLFRGGAVFSVWAFVCCVLLSYGSVVCRFILFECLALLLFFSAGSYVFVLLSCGVGCPASGSLVTSCPDLRYGLFLFCRCPLFCLLCRCSFLIVSLLSSFLLMWSLLSVGFYSSVSSFSVFLGFSWFFFLMAGVLGFLFSVWFLLSFLKSAVHADLPARRTAMLVLLQAMP